MNLKRIHSRKVFLIISVIQVHLKTQKEMIKNSGIPDIRVDDTIIDKTRVGFEDQPAYDKTLVIMDNKTRASMLDETKVLNTKNVSMLSEDEELEEDTADEETDDIVYEDENDDDDNLLSLINKRKKKKEEKKDNDEEDDDEESEEDEEKTQKMNKIITYVIIAIVGICIVVAAFFGVRYALSNFLGGSDKDKTVEKNDPEKDDDKKPAETPKDDSENDEENNGSVNIETNKAEIARLEKQLEQYEGTNY